MIDDVIGHAPRAPWVLNCLPGSLKLLQVGLGLPAWLQDMKAKGIAVPLLLDFAGTEAPLWAARELGIPFVHLASSDCTSGPQKFILRNFQPQTFFGDVSTRTAEELQRLRVGALLVKHAWGEW